MATATSQMDTSSATYPDPITDIDGTKTTGNDGTNNSSTNSPNTDSAQERCVSAENNYCNNNNNTLRICITMSIGLTDDVGRPLFDPKQAPWSSQHVKVKEWKPKSADLCSEVVCHWSTYNWVNHISVKPRPKKWGVDQSTAWLNDHPIDWKKDEISNWHEDVEFLVGEMKRQKRSIGKSMCFYS